MSKDENDSEATRYFMLQTSQEWSKDFGRKRGQQPLDQEKTTLYKHYFFVRQLTLQLAEAEANLSDKQKLVDLAQIEVKELRGRDKDSFEKYEKVVREIEKQKTEINRLKLIERDYNDNKVSGEFLLQSYRAALSKYKSWHEFASKQLETMKTILEESGRWNNENRYKIYFSYKTLPPTVVTDDQATELAKGSVVDYKGIDDIESINNETGSSRFLNNSTQTDDNNLSSGIDGSFFSFNSTANNESRQPNSSHLSSIRMSESEMQFLDLKERLKKMELENTQLKDQLFLARNEAKQAAELKEQNRDLTKEVGYLKNKVQKIYDEKERLAEDIQKNVFIDLAGPSKRATAREIIDKITLQKEEKDTLLRKTVEMEEEIRRLKANQNDTYIQGSSQPMSQTTVEESVVYRHMIDNPFQQAVKEHEERENIKRRRLETTCDYDPIKIQEHLDEIKKLKHEIDTLNGQHERARAFQTEFARRYRENVRNITGYDIKMRTEEFIEVSSIYDLGNHFEFQRDGKETNLLDNEYAKMWSHLMEKYLREYDSLACFMAAVTIDLRTRQLQLPSSSEHL